tara:strand:+ start:95 stop:571 length:477 start_codon:yes stop_codon:yes gene_type:complete
MYFQEDYIQDQNAMRDWRNSPDLSGGYPRAKRFGERDYAAMESVLGYTQEQEAEEGRARAYQRALRMQQLQDMAAGEDPRSDPRMSGVRPYNAPKVIDHKLEERKKKRKKEMWEQIAGMGAEGLSGLLVPPEGFGEAIDYSLFPQEQQINPYEFMSGG